MTELIGALLVVLDRNQQDHLERKMQSDPIPGINFAPLSSKLRADSLPSILNPSNLAIALTPLLPPISLGASGFGCGLVFELGFKGCGGIVWPHRVSNDNRCV